MVQLKVSFLMIYAYYAILTLFTDNNNNKLFFFYIYHNFSDCSHFLLKHSYTYMFKEEIMHWLYFNKRKEPGKQKLAHKINSL